MRNYPVLVICDTEREAKRLQREHSPEVALFRGDYALHGLRCSAVVDATNKTKWSRLEKDRFTQWLNEGVRCRLIPDHIDEIYTLNV